MCICNVYIYTYTYIVVFTILYRNVSPSAWLQSPISWNPPIPPDAMVLAEDLSQKWLRNCFEELGIPRLLRNLAE